MANLDRGAYDTDKLHDFDTDEMDDDSEKSRLPLLVLIALVVLAAFGGVVWLAYTQGVERGRADAPRIIVAQSPTNTPKSTSSPYAGLNIYQPSTTAASDSGTQNTDSLPPPPAPLAAEHPANTPPALRPSAAAKQEPPLPVPSVAASRPAAAETPNQAAQHAPAATALQKAETAKVPPTTQSAAADANNSPSADKSGVLLQIGSYKSDSEAMHSWDTFKARHAIAAPYRPDVQKVDLGAKGTWYRLRLGALADKKSAVTLCEKLKAQGASCLVAR